MKVVFIGVSSIGKPNYNINTALSFLFKSSLELEYIIIECNLPKVSFTFIGSNNNSSGSFPYNLYRFTNPCTLSILALFIFSLELINTNLPPISL
nr:MAG TPA: hypothetical protein [Bacteriophage sp.]